MAAILHQLFSAIPSLVQHALPPYESNGTELTNLVDTMFDILINAASDPIVTQIVCVIDALDECDENERVFLIEQITNFYRDSKSLAPDQQPRLKFLLTSRPYDDIKSQFRQLIEEVPTIHLSGDEGSSGISSEIDQVTTPKVQELAREKGFDHDTTNFLLDKLLQFENRAYLWLTLMMEETKISQRRGNRREIERLVSELPRSVMDAYDSILKKSQDKQLARELLHIILAAKIPLSLQDMRIATALAEDLSYNSYDDIGWESEDAFIRRIRNICGLFVTIDDGYVFLIHQTAKDYLVQKENSDSGEWKHSFRPQDSETLVASVCISFLSFEYFSRDLGAQGTQDIVAFHSQLPSEPFFYYAAQYWIDHCQSSGLESQEAWQPRITALCDTRSLVFQRWYAIYRPAKNMDLPEEVTSLNLVAELGFPNVLRRFLEQGDDPNVPDGHGATPLQRAAQNSIEATEILIKAGADVNALGWDSPWVAHIGEDGNEETIRRASGSPLYMAVLMGGFDIVECLVRNGASVNLVSGETTLLTAALMRATWKKDGMKIFQLLLDHGADPSSNPSTGGSKSSQCWTPLHYAALSGNTEAIKILMEHKGVSMNARALMKAAQGSTPLHVAVMYQQVEAVKLLLHHGADMHIRDDNGVSPRGLALSFDKDDSNYDEESSEEILKLLEAFDTNNVVEKRD